MNTNLSRKQHIVFSVLFTVVAFFVGDLMWRLFDPDHYDGIWGRQEATISIQPTIEPTPAPQELDPYGRFPWSKLEGVCRNTLDTWQSSSGVQVRYAYGDVEEAGETAYVVYTVYPVVILKDSGEKGQTWAVDFSYDPIRVYAQDDYFFAGVEDRSQFQPLDPDPYLERGLEIVPNHSPVGVHSEWHWLADDNGYFDWVPTKATCVNN